jgi:hypothetical protein
MVSSRAEAKRIGATRYLTGRECPQGHTAERMTSSGSCVVCLRARNLATSAEYQRRKRAADSKWRRKWNEYRAAWMAADRIKDPDKYRLRSNAWWRANRETKYAAVNARRALKRGQRCECCSAAALRAIYKAAALLRAEVDHRKPLAIGGKHCCKNLQILSPAAHRAKTARDLKCIARRRKSRANI